MDSVGRATDNNRIKRFFRSQKQEKPYPFEYETVSEIHALISGYIKYYNYKIIY